MRFARKLMLLSVAALAVMAIGATNASATGAIEVIDEATETHCNPCKLKATGELHLNQFGSRALLCVDTFEASITENGKGTINTWSGVDHGKQPCTRQQCRTGTNPPTPWQITSSEEDGPNTGEMVVGFCLENRTTDGSDGSGDANCSGDVAVTEPNPHMLAFTLHQSCFFGIAEVEGNWTQTISSTHPAIEIIHT